MFFTIFVVTLQVFLANAASFKSGCAVSVNEHLYDPQALILRPEGGENTNEIFYLPHETDGTIYFSNGDEIIVACPGGDVVVDDENLGVEISSIRCLADRKFWHNGDTVSFDTVGCSRYPEHTAKYNGKTCLNGRGNEISIGFEVGGSWINHITSCFDSNGQNVLYSEFNMTKSIQGFQSGFPRPSWTEGSFFNTDTAVNTLYTRATQRVTINEILGLQSTDTTYIQATNNYYLARGHLVAKADWVYGAQHRLTFYFVNAAPQFQVFNGGNWNTLEGNVRNFCGNLGKDIVVYTGTHGATSLPDVNGEQQDLYLYKDSNNNYAIAVPRLFWKVLYEPVSKAAIAFVGVNNPYQLLEEKDILCRDICDQVDWLSWKASDMSKGYSYCCDVEELRKNIENIPDFEVSGLLL